VSKDNCVRAYGQQTSVKAAPYFVFFRTSAVRKIIDNPPYKAA
jgi:hypothetical protein